MTSSASSRANIHDTTGDKNDEYSKGKSDKKSAIEELSPVSWFESVTVEMFGGAVGDVVGDTVGAIVW